jgi:hypothetical protein
MLSEILGIVEKTNTRPLLLAVGALALSTVNLETSLLTDPLSWRALALPILVVLAYLAVWLWQDLVFRLNSNLSDNDVASWGPLLGCTILAWCLAATLAYFARNPSGPSWALLGEANFVRLLAGYLLAIETIKIKRWR